MGARLDRLRVCRAKQSSMFFTWSTPPPCGPQGSRQGCHSSIRMPMSCSRRSNSVSVRRLSDVCVSTNLARWLLREYKLANALDLFLHVWGPSWSLFCSASTWFDYLKALGVRVALFPFVVACFQALGVRLGLFPPGFSCFRALGVCLGLFPPAFTNFGAPGDRLGLFPPVCWGSSGSAWVCFFLFLRMFGPMGSVRVCFFQFLHDFGPYGSVWVCRFRFFTGAARIRYMRSN